MGRLTFVRSIVAMRPFACFVALYFVAFTVLIRAGHPGDAIRTLGYSLMFVGLSTLTTRLTRPAPEGPERGLHLLRQSVLIFAAILATGIASASLGSEDDARNRGFVETLYGTGCWQFVIEVAVVFVGLRVLGLRSADLGLGLPAPSLRVALAWIVTALAFLSRDLLAGAIGGGEAASDVLLNVFRNGFSEEFLFRGALMSRLRLVLADGWALVAQALCFGAWHYGADVRAAQGNVVVTVCYMITVQGVFGYALGYLALRTRTVIVGGLFHAIADATDII